MSGGNAPPCPELYSMNAAAREDDEMRIRSAISLKELVPKQLCGEKGHHRQISAELTSTFSHSNSRTDPFSACSSMGTISGRWRCASRSAQVCHGISPVRWDRSCRSCSSSCDGPPPQAKRKQKFGVDNNPVVLPRVLCYSSKGSLEDRTCHVEWLLEVIN